ncbi:actin cytoskeleton-regulatory complex protein pan1 isoform X2 [Fopius arisanus]|nr:PREDICTED: actin cytoskeleton-regulatory complex protein pan1 isoform X2 [Fopius arisanus]XP_011301524.1 PREDICTED: actin cytoskeleton-regulatory complex protein pan1 isoform X2 [Fopius arisanus]
MPTAEEGEEPVVEDVGQLEDPDEPPGEEGPRQNGQGGRAGIMKPLVVLALPGMYLFYKYSQYRREQRELSRRRITERELQHLHHKIDKLLTKLEENEPEMASSQEDECVICVNARATMQTAPCGHRVVCRRCFVKTIQMAVSQRLLPLRCVICRAKILRLKQTLIPRDYSMSGKSWVLPQSASEYNMGGGVGTSGGGRWVPGSVPASASLYSMASGSSSISGVSSVSSATSSSASSSGSSSMSKPTRLRQPTGATLRRTQTQSMKMRIQEYQDPIQQIAEDDDAIRDNRERRLPPIKEFQRDYRAGKASTRLRCAQKIVTQLEISPTHRVPPSNPPIPSSSSSSASTRASTKRPSSAPRTVVTVAQEVQKSKKEKEKEKEREKAEKARQKEEEKAEKARAKEAKKLAKEEKKRAKKEAKARRKEAEESLLRDDK